MIVQGVMTGLATLYRGYFCFCFFSVYLYVICAWCVVCDCVLVCVLIFQAVTWWLGEVGERKVSGWVVWFDVHSPGAQGGAKCAC